ncbi:hypothetical protein GCM10010341_90450 [Streptomyces noursei]|nr:hypothetical protein GCM10010341_90450 [Streptomyces noursei]
MVVQHAASAMGSSAASAAVVVRVRMVPPGRVLVGASWHGRGRNVREMRTLRNRSEPGRSVRGAARARPVAYAMRGAGSAGG